MDVQKHLWNGWENGGKIYRKTSQWRNGRRHVKAQSRTINTRLKLLQYNWLMRTYITPEKLNKYNSAIPDICYKYEKENGSLFHCIWQCTEMQTFWQEVKPSKY